MTSYPLERAVSLPPPPPPPPTMFTCLCCTCNILAGEKKKICMYLIYICVYVCVCERERKEGRKEIFYLMMHSTHYIYDYGKGNMVKDNSDNKRGNTLHG